MSAATKLMHVCFI